MFKVASMFHLEPEKGSHILCSDQTMVTCLPARVIHAKPFLGKSCDLAHFMMSAYFQAHKSQSYIKSNKLWEYMSTPSYSWHPSAIIRTNNDMSDI